MAMTSPTGSDAVCYPTRIVSGAIHRMDRERTLYAHGKKNEWDVLLGAFRRYLRGTGTADAAGCFQNRREMLEVFREQV